MDFKMPWTKKEIEAEIPGLGGHIAGVHPYGLSLDMDLGPAYPTKAQPTGTLGSLEALGLTQSHPYMLEEAYLHPDVNFDFRQEVLKEEWGGEKWLYEAEVAEI